MTVSLVQYDIVMADSDANRSHLDKILASVSKTDIIVLPEMFSTGFIMEPEGIAEQQPFPSLDWMRLVAAQKDCAVAGSMAVCEDGKYYNRFFFVKPDGSVAFYDKKHLFSYSGEDIAYTAGNERVVVEWRGVRFLLLVCYDLRFPAWCRYRGDYDAVLCVANWPASRRYAWNTLLAARAIENQCYICGVNRIGSDNLCEYDGGTRGIDPYGTVCAQVEDNAEGVVSVELDIASQVAFRDKFPVLADADEIIVK